MSELPRQRLQIRAIASTAAAVLAVGLAACVNEPTQIDWPDGTPLPPQPAAAQTPAPPDPAEAEAIEQILSLVHGFRQAELVSYADPQPPHRARRDLSGYLADPLLSRTLTTLADMRKAGVAYEGRPTWDPIVAELRLDEAPPTATVRDCIDATDWQSVFQETGNPVPGEGRPDRYVMHMDAKQFDDGWRLHNAGMEVDAQC